VKKKNKNGYCSSVVHLLRDRKFGNWSYQNALNGNIRRCSKHRMWQACENHSVYDDHFNECRLLFFVMCQGAIRAINDALYNETTTHAHESLRGLYTLNVVKEYDDIYIEMRDLTDIDNFRMTIDVKKIIPKVPNVENEEWETLQNVKWGPLINETYDDIIYSIGDLTDSATRELKGKTSEDMWEGRRLKETYGIITTSITQRSSNRFYYLEPRLKTNYKKK